MQQLQALYGSNAANGAIVITTKKGKEGRLQLTVSQNTEFMRPFRTPEFQNRYGTGDNSLNSGSVEKSWGNRLNSSNYMGYNPISDFLQTGVVTTESVTLSTGTERNQTYFSASAVNSKGMIPNNNYNRYNFTFRNTTSFLQDKMTLDVSSSYTNKMTVIWSIKAHIPILLSLLIYFHEVMIGMISKCTNVTT